MNILNEIPIIIPAFNRPHVLRRILRSLERAHYSRPVKLIISIDGGGDKDVVDIAKGFQWNFGPKEVIERTENLGLKGHILFCGDLSRYYRAVIVLEDDLYVAPFFYGYALQALDFYERMENIAGISLYAHRFNETARFPFSPLQDGGDVFFLQIACSWGQCWTNQQWASFKEWYGRNTFEAVAAEHLVASDVVAWPATSWKKMYIAYMVATNRFFVYPYASLTTNFGDPGTHHKGSRAFQVPLLYGDKKFSFKKLEDSVAVYDSFCEILPSCLNQLCPWLKEYSYEVDLYAAKPADKIKAGHVLTGKQCRSYRKKFGRELRPLEANIIEGVFGEDLFLAETKECEDPGQEGILKRWYQKKEVFYHYPLLPHFQIQKVI